MATRIFLVSLRIALASLRRLLLPEPGSLAEAAGVAFQSPTGSTELRAMYGGLQIAIGALAGLAALRASLARPALLAIAFLTAGLGSARLARRRARRRHLVVHRDGARFRAHLGVDRGAGCCAERRPRSLV